MKIEYCFLDNVFLTSHKNFRWKKEDGTRVTLFYYEKCESCNEPYLSQKNSKGFCSIECYNNSEQHSGHATLPGNLNPNWQGGKSYGKYCSIWSDKEYKKSIKKRDKNKCQNSLCQGNYKKLDIHHIDYDKKNCHPDNLILICTRCNSTANFNREWWTCFYTEIIRRNKKCNSI